MENQCSDANSSSLRSRYNCVLPTHSDGTYCPPSTTLWWIPIIIGDTHKTNQPAVQRGYQDATEPLYPTYLPVRPEGFTPTLDIPAFDTDEPGLLTSKSNCVGTEIRRLQLSQLTPAGLDQVALLAAHRGVLVFRGQDFADIGPERQLEIARLFRLFGPLHRHPTMGYLKGTGPEFQVVYADEKVGNLRDLLGSRTNYDLWHVDQTFTPNTPDTTFFWVLEIPVSGGCDTAFASLTAAYKALSPTFREALHLARVGQERALKEAVKTEHPLVTSHPVTKEPVIGCKPSESDLLLGFLYDHIRSLDFSCRDQRTVAHSAVPDFADGERRHMVRIVPYGSQPQPL
ncbi:TauD/TfdA dioxygenase family protein [Aspergillus undulatus]|uniref:TauD/TfdA dioxygenase family protein n=1 Tax=Aspergillus undulatus TaxID=1810928 RepID=UPI003CCD9607